MRSSLGTKQTVHGFSDFGPLVSAAYDLDKYISFSKTPKYPLTVLRSPGKVYIYPDIILD
jgi:hypothetical protein